VSKGLNSFQDRLDIHAAGVSTNVAQVRQ